MAWSGMIKAIGLAAVFGLSACMGFEESGLPGSSSSMARNQIMLVEEVPPTFGYRRLTRQMRAFPDMAAFVGNEGVPNFLAETKSNGQDYFILYYLSERQAFACRTRSNSGRRLEFSGPYPVTDKEYQLLNDVRKKERR